MEIEEQYRSFAKIVRTHRKRAGLKQTELAHHTGLTRSTIANIESGRQRVMLFEAMKISKFLKFSLDNLPLASDQIPLVANLNNLTSQSELDPSDLAQWKKFITEVARNS